MNDNRKPEQDKPMVAKGLWAKTMQSSGKEFWTGSLTVDDVARIVELSELHPEGKVDLSLFVNDRKQQENHPDLNLYFKPGYQRGGGQGPQARGPGGGGQYEDGVPFDGAGAA